jgi:hypothetical protein
VENSHSCVIGKRRVLCAIALIGGPILNFQSLDAAELPFVVGHQNEARRPGMRGDRQIVVADHAALGRQCGPDRPVEFAGPRRERHYRKQPHQFGQLLAGLFPELTFFCAVYELAIGDDRKRRLARRM